jgi:hypothetical protein
MTLLTGLPVQVPTAAGLVLTFTSLGSNSGMTFQNTGKEYVLVSTTGTATTVSEKIGKTVQGSQPPANTVSVQATTPTPEIIGPFSTDYNQPGGNLVELDFSANTGVSVAVMRFQGAL